MKLHRFIGDFNLHTSEIRITEPELVKQLVKVLRLKIGEQIVLCDGRDQEVLVKIMLLDSKFVLVKTEETPHECPKPAREAHLYCAIIKRENFELVAQKAVEVGAASIVPIVSRRTVKLDLKLERLTKIMKEAAELSGRGIVPPISTPLKYTEALQRAEANDLKLLFESQAEPLERVVTSKNVSPVQSVAVFIGPEGGWDDEEIESAKQYGFQLASMGNMTFRAETAAIIATYLLSHTN